MSRFLCPRPRGPRRAGGIERSTCPKTKVEIFVQGRILSSINGSKLIFRNNNNKKNFISRGYYY